MSRINLVEDNATDSSVQTAGHAVYATVDFRSSISQLAVSLFFIYCIGKPELLWGFVSCCCSYLGVSVPRQEH